MEIETRIDQIGRVFHVQIGLTKAPVGTPLTPAEAEAFRQKGEPLIACGGTFGTGEDAFSLPAEDRRLPSQFPIKQLFSLDDHDDAATRASTFRSAIEDRMETARDTILEESVGPIGHFITTV